MHQLPVVDTVVLVLYMIGILGLGLYLARRNKSVDQFTFAMGRIPGWAVALSLFGTFVSSLSFLAIPGKAYGGNWNAFVFSLTVPIGALVAVKWFIPFYRRGKEVSAYTHLEARFGPWARTYAMLCYLLTQVARIGAILFGVALVLNSLLGWDMAATIIVTGTLVTAYTLLGGIEAVVWTDVVQSVVLIMGAVISLFLLVFGMPEGPGQIFQIAAEHQKFSLGSFGTSLTDSTVWVVLLYGIFINLTNFGIDQDQVQRYHVARSERSAVRAVLAMALMYVPVSLMFFAIGTCLFAHYQAHPELLGEVTRQVAAENLGLDPHGAFTTEQMVSVEAAAVELTASDVGDQVFPHFIVNGLPTGLAGLLIAALVAAAMSSIDTSLNCSATILLKDFYGRYIARRPSERAAMNVLRASTLIWGVLGTTTALLLIGVRSLLDAWWLVSGIFSGAMLGIFLLGFISKRADNASAIVGVVTGLLVIVWMTFSPMEMWPESLEAFRSPFHANMVTVIGTLTIFLVGVGVARLRTKAEG